MTVYILIHRVGKIEEVKIYSTPSKAATAFYDLAKPKGETLPSITATLDSGWTIGVETGEIHIKVCPAEVS